MAKFCDKCGSKIANATGKHKHHCQHTDKQCPNL